METCKLNLYPNRFQNYRAQLLRSVVVADLHAEAQKQAQSLDLSYVDARDHDRIKNALTHAEVVITATGQANTVAAYSKEWFYGKTLAEFGNQTIAHAHPADVTPSYSFLASEDSRFMTGQVLHPNDGEIING